MREISDLTRDIRPSLEDLLIEAVYDIIELDKQQKYVNGELVEQENKTFYYRVIYLFMQRSVLYYTNDEVEMWSKKELLKEVSLPKIERYEIDSQ